MNKLLYNLIAIIKIGIKNNYNYIKINKYNKFCLDIIEILYINGYIRGYIVKNTNLIIYFKFYNINNCNKNVLENISVFLKSSHLYSIYNNKDCKNETFIVSTNTGLKYCLNLNLSKINGLIILKL